MRRRITNKMKNEPKTTITTPTPPQPKKKWIKPEMVVIEMTAGGGPSADSVESTGS